LCVRSSPHHHRSPGPTTRWVKLVEEEEEVCSRESTLETDCSSLPGLSSSTVSNGCACVVLLGCKSRRPYTKNERRTRTTTTISVCFWRARALYPFTTPVSFSIRHCLLVLIFIFLN
jgi:hypothetical protein